MDFDNIMNMIFEKLENLNSNALLRDDVYQSKLSYYTYWPLCII